MRYRELVATIGVREVERLLSVPKRKIRGALGSGLYDPGHSNQNPSDALVFGRAKISGNAKVSGDIRTFS